MLGVVNPLGNLEIVVYHEVGHVVVTKLLRRPVGYIELEHNNQAGTWQGKVIKDESSDDPDWLSLDLDQYIPYDEFQVQYPRYPEPYEEYKSVREDCAVDYAGIVSEELLYEQIGIERSAKQLAENKRDVCDALGRVMKRFPPQEGEEELQNAETYARKILSNATAWEMVENLAKKLINDIHQGKPSWQEGYTDYWQFGRRKIYVSFAYTLKKRKN